jgi:hypothetical protein
VLPERQELEPSWFAHPGPDLRPARHQCLQPEHPHWHRLHPDRYPRRRLLVRVVELHDMFDDADDQRSNTNTVNCGAVAQGALIGINCVPVILNL